MNYYSRSIFNKNIPPWAQAIGVFFLIIVFILLSKLMSWVGISSVKPGAPWMVFTSFMLFFALINSVLSLASDSSNKYWMWSIISYVLLGVTGGVTAYLFSGLAIDEAGSYRWILFIFTFCYLLFLSIVRAMKKIVLYAQKQDKRLRGED